MKILYKYSMSLDIIRGVAEYELREHKIKIDNETEKQIHFWACNFRGENTKHQ